MSTPPNPHPLITPDLTKRFTAGPQAAGGSGPAAGRSDVVRLIGTVVEGVEHGCVVLVDDGGAVLANLTGRPTHGYRYSGKVAVTGRFISGMVTTCQQGKPFAVTEVTQL